MAAWDRARVGSVGEEAVYAGLAHFVVAGWVDEEAEGGVEVTGGFADWADFVRGVHATCGRGFDV